MATLIIPLVYPKAFEDESPIGYLIRVVEANGYKRVQWLFSADGEPFSFSPQKLLEALIDAKWTGFYTFKELISAIYNVDQKLFRFESFRYCKECLKERPYHRASWQLSTTVVCVKHRMWLIDECRSCGSKLNFKSMSSITSCCCGESLIDVEDTNYVPTTVLRMQNFLDGKSCIAEPDFGFSHAFNGPLFDREYRLKLIINFIRWQPSENMKNLKTGYFTGLNTFPEAKYYSTACADAWFATEEDFQRYLSCLHSEVFSDQSRGDIYFKRFYQRIFSICTHPSQELIITSIQNYLKDHWTYAINKKNTLFSKEAIENHKWIALQPASSEYNISKAMLREGITSGSIRSRIRRVKSRENTVIHRDDVVEFINQEKTFVNAKVAISLLGITKSQFYALIESGFIEGISPDETVKKEWVIHLEDIYALKNSVFTTLPPIEVQYIYLPEAIKNPFITIVTAIKTRELKAFVDPKYVGFRGVCIDIEDLKDWYLLKQKKKNLNYFSINSLRRYFQVSSMLVPQLVEKGLIQRIRFSKRDEELSITHKEVDTFKNRYVLLSKLSRVCEVSSAVLMELFSEKGIYPVDDDWEKPEQFVQKIYYRYELIDVPEVRSIVASMDDWNFVF